MPVFFTLSLDMLCVVGFDGYFKQLNPVWERTIGFTLEELQAKPFIEFLHPEDRETTLDEIQNLRAGLGATALENRYLCKDGSYKRFVWNSTVDPERRMLYSVAHDITERQQTEAALRESEERLRSVVNSAVDGFITIQEHGSIASFNPAAEKIFGYESAEVIGQNVKLLMPEPYHSEHDGYLSNYLRTGQKKIIGIGREVVGRRKDGTLFPMDLGISEFRVGEQRMFTGIVCDITERKQTEAQLERQTQELVHANSELTSSNKELDDFAYIASHDLKHNFRPLDKNIVFIEGQQRSMTGKGI